MFLFIALVLLLFGVHPQYGNTVQMVAVSFFIFEGLVSFAEIAILKKSESRTYCDNFDLSVYLLCVALPILSVIALVFNGQPELLLQTITFMFCAISARLIILRKGVDTVLNTFIYVSFLLVLITVSFEPTALLDGLRFATNESGGRARFEPFYSHPNLTANIFGVVLLSCANHVCWFYKIKNKMWYLALFSSVFSAVILFSTSSRGGMVATCCALLTLYFAHLIKASIKHRAKMLNILWIVIVLVTLAIMTKGNSIEYLSDLFELNSEFRGLDSGLTGRSDNWPKIVALSVKSTDGVVFGHGIRSWDGGEFEIATDSSYVNTLWESGVIMTSLIIMLLLRKIFFFFKMARSFATDVYLVVLVFATVESVVARYLLGIGNPGSLIFLAMLLTPEKIALFNVKPANSVGIENN
jgi:hypothetical protein